MAVLVSVCCVLRLAVRSRYPSFKVTACRTVNVPWSGGAPLACLQRCSTVAAFARCSFACCRRCGWRHPTASTAWVADGATSSLSAVLGEAATATRWALDSSICGSPLRLASSWSAARDGGIVSAPVTTASAGSAGACLREARRASACWSTQTSVRLRGCRQCWQRSRCVRGCSSGCPYSGYARCACHDSGILTLCVLVCFCFFLCSFSAPATLQTCSSMACVFLCRPAHHQRRQYCSELVPLGTGLAAAAVQVDSAAQLALSNLAQAFTPRWCIR